jgi:IS30 family transposase
MHIRLHKNARTTPAIRAEIAASNGQRGHSGCALLRRSRYLFVAIDRATRWVFVKIKSSKTAANARAFLKALHQVCPIKISKILTDNGTEFTDRLFASRQRKPSGQHAFDQICQ